MGPQEIRALRGQRTRADFAKELGVTPLTVLRWELPDGNKEARRPRKNMVEALERLAASSAKAPGPAGLDPSDPESAALLADLPLLLPIRELITSASWQRGEDELLTLLASDRLKSAGGRALATTGLAQQQVMLRSDVRGALTTLLPLLAEVEKNRLPQMVAARIHVAAAVLFGAPDSRLFDPGRVNAHAAQAEALLGPDEEERVLIHMARMSSATFLGIDVFVRNYREMLRLEPKSAVPRCLFNLLKSIGAEVLGDASAGSQLNMAAIEQAEQLGMHGVAISALANRVAFGLHKCIPASELLALAARARRIAEASQIGPIEPLIRAVAGEAEAFFRLGRLEEARASCDTACELARRAGVPPFAAVGAITRIAGMTHDRARLESLAEALRKEAAASIRALVSGQLLLVESILASLDGDFEQSGKLALEAFETVQHNASADFITHDMLFEAAFARVLLSDFAGARAGTRRIEALLERLPSRWHEMLCLRVHGFISLLEERLEDAREQFSRSITSATIAEDKIQIVLAESAVALAERALDIAGADERLTRGMTEMARLGIQPRPLTAMKPGTRPPPPAGAPETLADRLNRVAETMAERLAAGTVELDLVRAAESLLPGKKAIVAPEERPSEPPPTPGVEHWFEVTDAHGRKLRFGVEGKVDEEQLAALRTITAVARRSVVAAKAKTADDASIDLEPDVLPELPDLVAAAPPMRKLRRSIAQLSGSRATILITGESGSGKEVVARAIHDLSVRARREYVAFNCASVPRDLFEGQLFGHKKGAFTGADSDRLGVIRAADKGTLFLDEIGELPLDVQPKLLRFLENGEVFPIGERAPVRVDVRVVAATHRDLAKLVREGLFREDLFYRLNVVPLKVPPLRERPADVIALAERFVGRFTPSGASTPELSPDAMLALTEYGWPGNVRELRNVVERSLAFGPPPPVLRASDLVFG